MKKNRRLFLKNMAAFSAGAAIIPSFASLVSGCNSSRNTKKNAQRNNEMKDKDLFFKISVAEWSFHRALFDKKMTNLDFPVVTKKLGIHAVEYVNTFFESAKEDYLKKVVKVTQDNAVENVLIMVDREGNLGALDDKERKTAIENHYKWVDAAKFLGCHSIRVNARGNGTAQEVKQAAISGLGELSEYGEKNNINVIVENHGGYSSNGQWLAEVIKQVGNDFCGTLPDFGNFCIKREKNPETGKNECVEEYDRYKGTKELMPYAKGVSAKSQVFDQDGNEANIDYKRMLKIVKDAGYTGYIGIEYSGPELSEKEGVTATKKLLERVGKQV